MRLVGFKNAGLAARPKFAWAAWGPAAAAEWRAQAAEGAAGGDGGRGEEGDDGDEEDEEEGSAAVASVSRAKAPTAADFFARYPLLHSYALRHLRAAEAALAANDGSSGGDGAAGARAEAGAHPGLFRALLVLARLRPSLLFGRGTADGPLAPAALVPPLLAVARAPVLGARQLAALALGPLVAPERRPALAAELAAQLPALEGGNGGDGLRSAVAAAGGHNALHGRLLQLEVLLGTEAAAAGGARQHGSGRDADGGDNSAAEGGEEDAAGQRERDSAAAAAVAAVAESLAAAAWLATPACRCAPVRAAFVRAAGQALRLQLQFAHGGGGDDGAPMDERLRDALEAACWEAVMSTVSPSASAGGADATPQRSIWLKECAQLLLGPLLAASLAGGSAATGAPAPGGSFWGALLRQLALRVPEALRSEEYEVRAAACKVAARQLPPALPAGALAGPAAGSLAALEACLWGCLATERSPKVRLRVLALAGALQRLRSGAAEGAGAGEAASAAAATSGLARAKQARAALTAATDIASKVEALDCMARALRPAFAPTASAAAAATMASTAAATAEAAEDLEGRAAALSSAAQPEALRLAAAGALRESGLLLPVLPRAGGANAGAAAPAADGDADAAALRLERASLRCWWHAVALMDDEDADVRRAAAAAAQEALAAAAHDLDGGGEDPAAASRPSQLRLRCQPFSEAVKPSAMRVIAAVAGNVAAPGALRADAARALTRAVFDAAATPMPAPLAALAARAARAGAKAAAALPPAQHQQQHLKAAAAGGDTAGVAAAGLLARRLFEREADNSREEPIQVAQLAARCLAPALPRLSSGGAGEGEGAAVVAEWGDAAAAWLEAAAGAVAAAPAAAAAAWVGGVCNHPEAFAPLAGCLLAARLAVAPGVVGADGRRPRVDGATAALRAAGLPLGLRALAECRDEDVVGEGLFLLR